VLFLPHLGLIANRTPRFPVTTFQVFVCLFRALRLKLSRSFLLAGAIANPRP